ncbi:glycerophosphoryl diester phosphodiesterase [Vibrio nitrifigilis]|uniref:Glycerophosphoryl diester phosphodiesterase n=1 Tax=Vibrio nitrifigilis TaxID=2789781 RepID=A0ABS0GM96_9VIBR|nr:glycerophosphoryl diester phosphodiesterase [Vibrio nitrifigilis]MBF9003579.1 glycerophosphoryl diester phosphodiesterase [Vibrio nitrifigilis]
MKITAHRGLSSQAPENTMSAFLKAIEFGVPWIELDTQLSSDGIPVVIHDQTVNRCTNGSGIVTQMSLAELQSLDAGLWFSDTFRGEKIPTLESVLSLTKSHSIAINIELKTSPGDDVPTLCEKVAQLIIDKQFNPEQLLFSSFDTRALIEIKRHLPTIRRGHLWQEIPEDAEATLHEIDAFSVHCDYRFLTKPQARRLKAQGYEIYCYTPNFPTLVKSYWNWGVDMMITDTPQSFLEAKQD